MTTALQKTKHAVGLAVSLLCLLCTQVTWLQAQTPNTWEQKSNLPPNDINGPGARLHAVGFSIGTKGYIGTGYDDTGNYTKDFWEYDPATNSWTQKADFGGTARHGAVGFGIGNKGYIGTGYDNVSSFTKDFWEYDPTTNSWTQKADFGGTARYLAVGFSIGNKGYVGTGTDNGDKKDFWEYDPVGNSWAQKADFGGTNRFAAVGFSIGSKGYLGTGRRFDYDINGNLLDIYLNDFWEYDPTTNNWMQKANVGGGERAYAVGFSTSGKGYLGTGTDGVGYKNDFWEYNPDTNSWIKKADAGGGERYGAVGFGIGSKGYIGTGYGASGYKKDLWEYDPSANNWIKKAEQLLADNLKRYYAVGFSIGNKGYIGTGLNTSYTQINDFWEYDPATNTWTQKADFGGTPRNAAVGFSIGNKGYIGTGVDNTGQHTKDFWEYDPSTNTWTKKADFGGVGRYDAVGFSIGSKGYIGTGMVDGFNYITTNDFWEYDPSSDTWTKKADFGGGERHVAVGFGIGSKGYIGTGASSTQGIMEDFWEYNPSTNSWAQKANFGGGYLGYAVGFSMGGKGYVGTGTDFSYGYTKAFWEYNPVADTWTKKADFGGTARSYAVGFGIGNKGYIGTGNDYGITNDFWAYTPESTCNLSASIAPSTLATICAGANLALSGSSTGGTAPTYSWSAGGGAFSSNQQNPYLIAPLVSQSTPYTITLMVKEGSCTAMASISVTVNLGVATISSNSPVCEGSALNLSAPGGNTYTWSGPGGYASTLQNPRRTSASSGMAGTYSVSIRNASGCMSTATTSVVVSANIAPSITSLRVNSNLPNAQNTVSVCSTQAVNLTIAATNAVTYSWRGPTGAGSGFTSSLVSPVSMPIATPKQGQYTITVRNGCTTFNQRVINIQLINCTANRLAQTENTTEGLQLVAMPNPTKDKLTVEITLAVAAPVRLELTDLLGRRIAHWQWNESQTTHRQEVSLEQQASGVYLLMAEAEGTWKVQKIVKY
jgi:N-acetylneuraminic acid mutarotase